MYIPLYPQVDIGSYPQITQFVTLFLGLLPFDASCCNDNTHQFLSTWTLIASLCSYFYTLNHQLWYKGYKTFDCICSVYLFSMYNVMSSII